MPPDRAHEPGAAAADPRADRLVLARAAAGQARALGHRAARPLHAAALRLGGFPRRARRPRRRPATPSIRTGSRPSANSASRSSAGSSTAAWRWSCARRWSPGTCWARRARPAAPCATSTPRSSGCRSRPTASSRAATSSTCNGRRLPMTGDRHARRGGGRRALQGLAAGLRPAPDHPGARAADLRHHRHLDRPLARRLRLPRRPSRRAQLRHLPGQRLRGRGAAPRALPGPRPYAGSDASRRPRSARASFR